MKLIQSILSSALLALLACGSPATQGSDEKPLETIQPEWAQGFLVEKYPLYTKATIFNPWSPKREKLATYYLISAEQSREEIPTDGEILTVPLHSVAATSSTHFGFLDALESLPAVAAICYPDRIYNAEIRQRYAAGELVDLEDPFQINFERLIALRPEAVITSGYNQMDETSLRIRKFGIPVIFNNEWMESTPLARAEWIKFMALFFDRSTQADSLFAQIETNYLELKEKATAEAKKPQILNGENFRGTWYMPGGNNWMAHLFADAGAAYHFATDTTRGSLPLSTESVLRNFNRAEVWVNPNANSLEELRRNDSRHAIFEAFKRGAVYANDATSVGLGNNYWEEGVVRPDYLLSDYVALLHPHLLPNHPLRYLRKLPQQ